MTLSEVIYEKSRLLPEDKAQEVIDFIDFLIFKSEHRAISVMPNTETKAAIEACRQGDVARFDTIAALMADLNAED